MNFREFVEQRLARRGRDSDADDFLQLVDRGGRARAARHDPAGGPGIDGPLDGAFCLVQQLRHAAAGDVVLGVRVRIEPL